MQVPDYAPLSELQRLRSYSRRKPDGTRETWEDTTERVISGITELGNLTDEEVKLVKEEMLSRRALGSGRYLWVGGTPYSTKPENYYSLYNCSSVVVDKVEAFELLMRLAMQGCGTGSVVELEAIDKLPSVVNRLKVTMCSGEPGDVLPEQRIENTLHFKIAPWAHRIVVGDSRDGWTKAYSRLIELATDPQAEPNISVHVDVSHVRPAGQRLKGFGGVSNPIKLKALFPKVANILNGALDRDGRLNSLEVMLLLNEAASVVVAGNIRRCLPFDALVHTSNGLIPIKDVQVGDMVQTPIGFRRVTNKFYQGFQEVYDVKTNATTPRATLNHRFGVLSNAQGGIQWKHLGDVNIGDRLMHNTQILSGVLTHLPEDSTASRPEQSRNAKPIVIPDLSPEVAWLIGYTHGNGYVSLGRNKHGKPFGSVSWSMNATQPEQTKLIQDKIDLALSGFNLTARHVVVTGENTAKSTCCAIRLAEYFYKHIKQPKAPLQVPAFILQGTADIRASYLAGLADSDGAIHNRPPHLVTTVYPNFARQVGVVLSSLGIAGRIKKTAPQKDTWQTKHNVTIPAFKTEYNSLIAVHSVKGAIKNGRSKFGFTLPKLMVKNSYNSGQLKLMGLNVNQDSNYERFIAETGDAFDIPVTVNGLGGCEFVQTYDIEVEEAHCFYCDGYLMHNSASINQGSASDDIFKMAKANLWSQDNDGNWKIDPDRDCLRMANHTRVFHTRPTLEECLEAVTLQFYSGEGAVQYAPECILRGSADVLGGEGDRQQFLKAYEESPDKAAELLYLKGADNVEDRLLRYGANPCFEIVMNNNLCNLAEVHLDLLDPHDIEAQQRAFEASTLHAVTLLHHRFVDPILQASREIDPIVGVSFTGAFTFFTRLFGLPWLEWFSLGRPDDYELAGVFNLMERSLLAQWRIWVEDKVASYCEQNGLRVPNRATTVKPSGSMTLLSGVGCCGYQPPKAWQYIRRMTFAKDDPIALAAIDYGYSVVPSQSDTDEQGNLLNDPFDPRCTEWLVEVPVRERILDEFPDAAQYDPNKFPIEAQFKWFMQVQNTYAGHQTSTTLEITEGEIPTLAELIHNHCGSGFTSCAILARFDAANSAFPRLPFEPISDERYEQLTGQVLDRRLSNDFNQLINKHDSQNLEVVPQDSACGDGFCALKQ